MGDLSALCSDAKDPIGREEKAEDKGRMVPQGDQFASVFTNQKGAGWGETEGLWR